MRRTLAMVVIACVAAIPLAAADRVLLVVCAPGFPGDTEQAQPTMDAFASQAALRAGWPAGSLTAIYHEQAEPGIEAMRRGVAGLALVPLAFWVEYGEELGLTPRLQAAPGSGSDEEWTLVAAKGKLTGPQALDGWQLLTRAGYAPDFVTKVVLADWGPLPDSTRVEPTARALSALRRAARGEQVAVLLDGEQSAALDALPFAGDLDVVYRSRPLPASLLCTIDERLDPDRAEALLATLLTLHDDAQGAEVLGEMRLTGFRPLQTEALDRVRRAVGP